MYFKKDFPHGLKDSIMHDIMNYSVKISKNLESNYNTKIPQKSGIFLFKMQLQILCFESVAEEGMSSEKWILFDDRFRFCASGVDELEIFQSVHTDVGDTPLF